MDDNEYRSSLKKKGVKKIITLISRRAAGVWSLLPSLACQNLHDMPQNADILLLDFGRRHEMLEHLQINPDLVPANVSLSFACKINNPHLAYSPLEYFQDLILPHTHYPLLLANRQYEDGYKNLASNFSHKNKKLFLCPFDVGLSENQNIMISIEEFAVGLSALVDACNPSLVYLTFEGQPERPLFDQKLSEDPIMQYCLNISDYILSLVRTDSPTRFDEGIAIPNFLALNPEWETKILLFLTRHSENIVIPEELGDFVIGQSPFFDLIGQSIQSGRIPWMDFRIERYGSTNRDKINHYFLGLQKASEMIVNFTNNND